MMETILNLAWLAVTLAALWVWRFRWKGSRQNSGQSAWLESAAMVCVLALLFPVISLTDDLHPEVMPADCASSKRALCMLSAQNAHIGNAGAVSHPHFDFNCHRAGLAHVELQFAGQVSLPRPIEPVFKHVATSDRAPPTLEKV